jgi:hypothetical protein
LTHQDLVKIAEKWLLGTRKCSFVFTELACIATSEIPDAIGFRDGHSILVECKTSRSDFLADGKKYFRRNAEMGVGSYRFFMAPQGIISVQDLPQGWGLVEINEKGKPRQVWGHKSNIYSQPNHFHFERNLQAENGMMASALRRLHLRGVLPMIYLGPIGAEYKKEAELAR